MQHKSDRVLNALTDAVLRLEDGGWCNLLNSCEHKQAFRQVMGTDVPQLVPTRAASLFHSVCVMFAMPEHLLVRGACLHGR